jgi:TonB family protein
MDGETDGVLRFNRRSVALDNSEKPDESPRTKSAFSVPHSAFGGTPPPKLSSAIMMTPDSLTPVSQRVSILERIIPSLGLIIAALSGAVGALLLFRFLAAMKQAETAGYAAFYGGMAEVELVVGMVLALAAFVLGVGVVVSVVRLFTTNTTSSPPGIMFLVLGLLSLVPPFALHYLMHAMKEIVSHPEPGSGGISSIAGKIDFVSYFAIGSGLLLVLVFLAFSFIPFSSRAGRKVSPLVCLIIAGALIVAMAGIYFWQGRGSLIERDRERIEAYSQPRESPTVDSDPVEIPGIPGDMLDDVTNTSQAPANTSSNSSLSGRTISGGVLNGKAANLPQPTYPPAARAVRAAGVVNVQVTVDERGDVVSAEAVSGHPLLRAAAVAAARQAKFAPTKLSGQSVKVTGVITYNFVMQ